MPNFLPISLQNIMHGGKPILRKKIGHLNGVFRGAQYELPYRNGAVARLLTMNILLAVLLTLLKKEKSNDT